MIDLIHYDKILIKSSPIYQFYNIHLKLWYIQINNRKNIYSKYILRIPIRWLQFHCNESIIISHPKPSLPSFLFFFFSTLSFTRIETLSCSRADYTLHEHRYRFYPNATVWPPSHHTLSWFDPCVFRRCVPTKAFFSLSPSPLPSDPPGKLQFQRIRRERAKCARAPERISRAEFFNANNSSAGWYDEHVNGFSLGVNVFLSFFFFVFVFFSFSETLELLRGMDSMGFGIRIHFSYAWTLTFHLSLFRYVG